MILLFQLLSERLIAYNSSLRDDEELSLKKAYAYIAQYYNTKIDYNYLDLLLSIIENYFDIKLKKPTEVGGFLDLLKD